MRENICRYIFSGPDEILFNQVGTRKFGALCMIGFHFNEVLTHMMPKVAINLREGCYLDFLPPVGLLPNFPAFSSTLLLLSTLKLLELLQGGS